MMICASCAATKQDGATFVRRWRHGKPLLCTDCESECASGRQAVLAQRLREIAAWKDRGRTVKQATLPW